MKRREFLKKCGVATAAVVLAPCAASKGKESAEPIMLDSWSLTAPREAVVVFGDVQAPTRFEATYVFKDVSGQDIELLFEWCKET